MRDEEKKEGIRIPEMPTIAFLGAQGMGIPFHEKRESKMSIKTDAALIEELERLSALQGCSVDEYVTKAVILRYELEEMLKLFQWEFEKVKAAKENGTADPCHIADINGQSVFVGEFLAKMREAFVEMDSGEYLMKKDLQRPDLYTDKWDSVPDYKELIEKKRELIGRRFDYRFRTSPRL